MDDRKVREFDAPLKYKNKRCRFCGKTILVGEVAHIENWIIQKFYPIKGVKGFRKTYASHPTCTMHKQDS
mgnify:CR=1 FL=1